MRIKFKVTTHFYLIFTLLGLSAFHQGKDKLQISKDATSDNLYIIHEISIPRSTKTTFQYELRFFKIKSALDAMVLMYENYGPSNETIRSKFQENIDQHLWYNVKLLDDEQKFTVAADGTETMTNYFACLSIFDEKSKNCLAKNHPLREKLTNLFVTKFNNMKRERKSIEYVRMKK